MIPSGIGFCRFVFNLRSRRKCGLFVLFLTLECISSAHSKLIDESSSIFLQQFEANNPKTNNYGTLIEVFIRLASAVRDECDE